MAEQKKIDNVEREYMIPLRFQWKRVPRYKRANKAVKAIKEFLVRHMKVRDRDLNKIKIDKYLNEEIWFRGIRKPPARIKVKVKWDGDVVRAELSDMPEKLRFKKAREEKIQKAAEEKKDKKKTEQKTEEKSEDSKQEETKSEESDEKNKDTEEKKASVVEEGKALEKQAAKKQKHQTKQSKQPKHQKRKALAK